VSAGPGDDRRVAHGMPATQRVVPALVRAYRADGRFAVEIGRLLCRPRRTDGGTTSPGYGMVTRRPVTRGSRAVADANAAARVDRAATLPISTS
jgi:hypothetical protein